VYTSHVIELYIGGTIIWLMKLCVVIRAMEEPEVEHLSSEEVSYCPTLQCDVTSYCGI
jgi:hypothetical protein